MKIPYEMILSFSLGLAVIAMLGYLLLVPRRFLWRMAAGAVIGGVMLLMINAAADITGYTVPVNPLTALTAGFLGLPGALLVIMLSIYL